MDITVIIPTHNPHPGRLRATLLGLRQQDLAPERWETLLVDNASTTFPAADHYLSSAPSNLRVVKEPTLGLTSARLAGFRAAKARLSVMVDDDNVLAPNYLSEAIRIFERNERLGAAGGKSLAQFETPPSAWQLEFTPLLAIRDLGESEIIATTFRPYGSDRNEYPACSPIGAGMVIRTECALLWADAVASDPFRRRLDRSGAHLVSGGDNDIVMTLLEKEWAVGYFPALSLRHVIPTVRLESAYLSRLNRAIRRSWVQVLDLHGANPWPRVAPYSVPLRKAKAYIKAQAWRSTPHHIRWRGICGQFEGQASIKR
jgi:glycosyltransferase involved in cell wall biosynthesis